MVHKGGVNVMVKLRHQEIRPGRYNQDVGASLCLRFGMRETRCPTHRW